MCRLNEEGLKSKLEECQHYKNRDSREDYPQQQGEATDTGQGYPGSKGPLHSEAGDSLVPVGRVHWHGREAQGSRVRKKHET